MRIVDYEVVSIESRAEIVRVINSMINEGWQPLGGISGHMSIAGSFPIFTQAMVRYA